MSAARPVLVLLSKPGCHLCHELRAVIDRVLPAFDADLEERDVRADPETARRYALVASGHLSPRPVDGPEVPWMGIYPDLTGLLVQFAIVAVVAGGALMTLRRRRAEAAPST